MIAALHTSALATALPVLASQMRGDMAQAEWVTAVYFLVLSGTLVGFGRAGDRFGHRFVYLWGLTVFTFTSGLCGLAMNITVLIVLRAIQALGAAMISGTSMAILARHFPAAQRGRSLGRQAAVTYIGLAIGPILGGFLVARFNWRAIFFVTVPMGLLAWAAAFLLIPRDRELPVRRGRFEGVGSFGWMAVIAAFLIAVNRVQRWGWHSYSVLALAGVAILLLCALAKVDGPTGVARPAANRFRSVEFKTATAMETLYYLCLYAVGFLMPLYLILGRGFHATEAGLFIVWQSIARAVTAAWYGGWSDRAGPRTVTTVGIAILTFALIQMSQLASDTASTHLVYGLVLLGIGTGIFVPANSSALLSAVPRERQGMAAGILSTARNLGMALGIAVSGSVYSHFAGSPLATAPEVIGAVRIGFAFMAVVAAAAMLGSLAASWRPQEELETGVTF